jgi:hypothetical protein
MPASQRSRQPGSDRRMGIGRDLDGENLIAMMRQARIRCKSIDFGDFFSAPEENISAVRPQAMGVSDMLILIDEFHAFQLGKMAVLCPEFRMKNACGGVDNAIR